MFENVRRIFFDSGMVLVYPRSGDWFYPSAYKEYCEKRSLPERSFSQNLNFPRAYARLAGVGKIESEDEELRAFTEFYGALFKGIKGKDNRELIDLCAWASVKDYGKYEFYDDVEESIGRLKLKYDLGIISDAWPSLLSVYRARKMLSYFKPFIISSLYGCTKSGCDLFRFALANVAEHAQECLFIDDSWGNCKRAQKLGMQVLVLNRSKHFKERGSIPHAKNMDELEELLGTKIFARSVPAIRRAIS
jgi:putative hydrolase of the HAD superfamily